MNDQFAHITLGDLPALLVYDLCFPVIARLSNGSHFMYIFHAQMHTARPDGLAQPIIGIVLMVRKMLLPTLNQTGRHGLCPDMHQPPLLQQIMFHLHLAGVDGIQKILCPGHQQPHDGTFLLRHRPQDPLRLHAP